MGECGAERFGPAIAGIGCCSDAPNEVTGPGSRRRQWARNKEEGMEMSGNNSKPNGQGNSRKGWNTDPRWEGITRPYGMEDVLRLRGSVQIEHTLARLGAERLWHLLHSHPYVHALGALTGNQAVQMVQAGLNAIYASGWQVAADANNAGETYPDQSLYPADSCPALVRRINKALQRADQIDCVQGQNGTYWFAPIVADAEAGFGGPLNAFEIMKAMIEAGAAGVHFEDQLSSAKKCGHLGGKVVVPIREFVEKLTAARLAADVCGVPTILIARTDANSAGLLLADADARDREFLYGERTAEAGMTAYSKLQQEEFAAQELGYRAVTHQRFVGTGYFDTIAQVVSSGHSSTTALAGSTEAAQFHGSQETESSASPAL